MKEAARQVPILSVVPQKQSCERQTRCLVSLPPRGPCCSRAATTWKWEGQHFRRAILENFVLSVVIGCPPSWNKTHGGPVTNWVGSEIFLREHSLRLTERRASWVARHAARQTAASKVRSFEALSKLVFATARSFPCCTGAEGCKQGSVVLRGFLLEVHCRAEERETACAPRRLVQYFWVFEKDGKASRVIAIPEPSSPWRRDSPSEVCGDPVVRSAWRHWHSRRFSAGLQPLSLCGATRYVPGPTGVRGVFLEGRRFREGRGDDGL